MKHVFTITIDQSEAREILEEMKEECAAIKSQFGEEGHLLSIGETIVESLTKILNEIN